MIADKLKIIYGNRQDLLGRIKIAISLLGIKTIVGFEKMIPLAWLSIVKDIIRPIGTLDYSNKILKMRTSSHWEYYRLRSCKKEPETVEWIENNLRKDDVFFDVGANVGAYSLVAFAAKGAKIYAFEPSFATFEALCRNIIINHADKSIIPMQIGLSDTTGIAQFVHSEIVSGVARNSWADINKSKEPSINHKIKHIQHTICYTMDDLVNQFGIEIPSLIKIDVDGPEISILRGAEKTLNNRKVRSILIESESDKIKIISELLEKKGFKLFEKYARGQELFNYVYQRT